MAVYENIAVAVDFSEQSNEAVERAKLLALQDGAKLTLVAVCDTNTFGTVEAYDPKYAQKLAEQYKEQLEKMKENLITAGLQVETIVEMGSAKKILTSLPNVNLIVCGATGKSKPQQFVLGSISQAIVRYSPYDVLVVR